MKRLALLLTLLIPIFLISQPCLTEGIIFTSQTQIDSFQINNPDCTEIEGKVEIKWDDIGDLNGLAVLVSIGGDLFIRNTIDLTSLAGLDNLTTIGGDLYLGENTTLISLSGLENLVSIGGELQLFQDISLTNLSGLASLSSIGGDLKIYATSLTSLTGLDNISSGSIENLSIISNYYLANCEVESICEYLSSPNGTIEIQDNAPGCSSQEEVEVACGGVSIDVNRLSSSLSLSPNPFTTSTTIEYILTSQQNLTITFYNQFGKQVDVIEQKQSQGKQQVTWNSDGLPAGIYYFRLRAGEQMASGKVVLVR